MGRWLGIDYGTVRIGIAAGSSGDGIASPLAVIQALPEKLAFEQIREFTKQYEVDGVVVGWPLNMDDTEGPQGKLTRLFAVELAGVLGMDVRLWDERLSSFDADTKMAGLYTRKKKKARQDAVAAATILHDFLANGGVESAPKASDWVDP